MTPEEARERFRARLRPRTEGHRPLVRYAQYADAPPDGPVLAVEVLRWSGWAA